MCLGNRCGSGELSVSQSSVFSTTPALLYANPLEENELQSLSCIAFWSVCEIHHATLNSRSRPSCSLQIFSRAISKLRANVS